MKEKSEVDKLLEKFHTMVQIQFQSKIKVLMSDNGREYYKSTLKAYLLKYIIIHQSSCVDTPQQSDVAKRKNKHLL